MIKNLLSALLMAMTFFALAGCETTKQLLNTGSAPRATAESPETPVNLQGFPNDPAFWQGNTATVWNKLQHVPLPTLQTAANATTDPVNTAWLKLAIIGKQYSTNTPALATQLMAWRAASPAHPGNALFPDNAVLTRLQNTPPPKHVTLLLPLQGTLAASGQAVRNGFLSAYYASPSKSGQAVSFLDTTQTPDIRALYQQALAQGADCVVGPLTKEEVQQLESQGKFPVPTLALNYTDSLFGSLPANFYEFGLSPTDEAKQLAEKSSQTGHKHALLIAPEDAWGQRLVKTLTSNWQALGGTVVDTFYFNKQTDLNTGIANLLHANPDKNAAANLQRRQDFDIIFLLAPPESARQIVPLLKYYYAGNVPIYATSIVYSGAPNAADADLNGVTFADMPWTLQNTNTSAIKSTAGSSRLYALGRDAYLLGNQFYRLALLPNFPVYGATGALTLTAEHKIYRRLAWVQMRNGRP